MLAILDASDADFNKLINNFDGAGGSAENMANTMQNNLSGDITKLMSALQELAISIGTLLIFIYKDKFIYKTYEGREILWKRE